MAQWRQYIKQMKQDRCEEIGKCMLKYYERIRWEATTILYVNMNVRREVMSRK